MVADRIAKDTPATTAAPAAVRREAAPKAGKVSLVSDKLSLSSRAAGEEEKEPSLFERIMNFAASFKSAMSDMWADHDKDERKRKERLQEEKAEDARRMAAAGH